ncbi:pyocin knob domain-containing protein, partial [Photorhabdus bodei]
SRKINGKALSGDVNITSQDIFNGQAISIPDKADLNDYQTPGLYYQGLNVQATAGKNYPEASAGSLVVLQAAGTIQRYFVYNSSRIYTRALYPWSGPGWTPWAQEYNTQNKPIASELGLTDTVNLAKSAYPKSGGVLNGYVDATGSISGRGVYEYPSIRVYSAVNKPSPGELGAYTTGECDGRYGSKNMALKSTNGWWKCGDTGVIYQWGVTRVLEPLEIITVQLPVRFSNACVNVMLTVNRLGASGGIANGYSAVLSPSSFKLTNDYANTGISVGYYWFAVGY